MTRTLMRLSTELSRHLGWSAETAEDVVQGLLDDGEVMGTSDSGYRLIDD
jgi:hypothetical protein